MHDGYQHYEFFFLSLLTNMQLKPLIGANVGPDIALSLNKIIRIGLQDILSTVCHRSSKTINILTSFTKTRPIDILLHLHTDTVKTTSAILIAHQESKQLQPLHNRILNDVFESLEARHGMVVETIADARQSLDSKTAELFGFDAVINELLWTHTSNSLLLQQGLFLSSKKPASVSCVQEDFDIRQLVEDAKCEVCARTEQVYNWCPDIVVSHCDSQPYEGIDISTDKKNTLRVTCVPSLIRHALIETIKNAVQAIMQSYDFIPPSSSASSQPMTWRSVNITLMATAESVIIQIVDDGCGIDPRSTNNLFRFQWTSKLSPSKLVDLQTSYQPARSPLQGLGVGLCLAKENITHFGGSLVLESQGVGKGAKVTMTISKNSDITEGPCFTGWT